MTATQAEKAAMRMTYSPFYVPLIASGLAAAGITGALDYIEARGARLVPAGVAGGDWCDWAEALATANGWTDAKGGRATVLYYRMTHVWGTPGYPYAPADVQTNLVEALFKYNALLGQAMTKAAIKYMAGAPM
jgi:hypothetical protein